MDIKIPKIFMKLIVENAIYHGIEELDTTWNINIKSENRNLINIIIIDNGVVLKYIWLPLQP